VIAPIFPICAADPTVKSLLGDSPVRLYPFDLQDDTPVYPYAVWQNIDGMPENYLAQRSDTDHFSLQVDCYAKTPQEVIAVAEALRDAIEGSAYITRLGDQTRDPDTKLYRYSFDVDFIVKR
jgi:hypothetical protein